MVGGGNVTEQMKFFLVSKVLVLGFSARVGVVVSRTVWSFIKDTYIAPDVIVLDSLEDLEMFAI